MLTNWRSVLLYILAYMLYVYTVRFFFKNLSEIFAHLFGEFAKQALLGQKGVKLERWIFFLQRKMRFFKFVW